HPVAAPHPTGAAFRPRPLGRRHGPGRPGRSECRAALVRAAVPRIAIGRAESGRADTDSVLRLGQPRALGNERLAAPGGLTVKPLFLWRTGLALVMAPCPCAASRAGGPPEQWGIFEVSLKGRTGGNPFVDVSLSAKFTRGDRVPSPSLLVAGDDF